MPPTRILVTGGGTSGHISPALAVISALHELRPGTDVLYVGSRGGIEATQVPAAGVTFVSIQTGKLRRYLSFKNLVDQFRVPLGILQSLGILSRFRPDAVFATGGYVAVPPVVAAGLLRIPVLIHEQTAQIGLANRINARFARRIALSWESALSALSPKYRSRAWISGNPVRPQIFGGDAARAVAHFGLSDETLPTLYVTGGSLGARIINRAVEEALPELLGMARVIHQCGEQRNKLEQEYGRLRDASNRLPPELRARYAVRPYIRDELRDVFALADLVVGRAGASTVTELCALGKPAIYVPLEPTGGDEQNKNARMCVEKGAALVVKQDDLTGATLLAAVRELIDDRGRLKSMGKSALTLAHSGAAQDLARAVLELADHKPKAEAAS